MPKHVPKYIQNGCRIKKLWRIETDAVIDSKQKKIKQKQNKTKPVKKKKYPNKRSREIEGGGKKWKKKKKKKKKKVIHYVDEATRNNKLKGEKNGHVIRKV